MAFKPAGLASGSLQGYPGRLIVRNPAYMGAGQTAPSNLSNPCICGSPATKLFGNPRGVSESLNGPSTNALVLCDACDFRWTVMRAAGRSEEFITDYEEKQRVRAEEEARVEEIFRKKVLKDYQNDMEIKQKMMQAQQQQAQPAPWTEEYAKRFTNSIPGQICTENVQTPEEKKSMWDAVKEYVRRKNGR